MKRLIAVILTLSLLISAAVSCAETQNTEETTAPAVTEAPEALGGADATQTEDLGFYDNPVPSPTRFDGEVIKFLYWSDVENPEFFVEEQNGEAVNDAIYNRNAKVEEQLGVTLEFTGTPGNNKNQKDFINKCINSTQSGADAHDFFCGYSMTGAPLMCEGIAQDLTQYEIINFDKPWWPASLISKARIKDGIYFASGDISTNFLYMMYCCTFNKDLFSSVHVQDCKVLYDLVDNQQWTIDKLIEYSTGVYLDSDGDTVLGTGDRVGFFLCGEVHYDAFYTGCDLYTVVPAKDGSVQLSDDLFSEKTQNVLDKLCAFMHSSGDAYLSTTNIFTTNQAIFTIDRAQITTKKLTSASFTYGMLPVPKYNAEQEDYYTCMAFPFTTYVLSTASTHSEAAATTLELMAYHSYSSITPALFEEAMKIRYADASEDSRMFDIIRESVVIDLGRLLTTKLDNLSYSLFRNALAKNQAGSWSSMKTANSKIFNRKLGDINKELEKLG